MVPHAITLKSAKFYPQNREIEYKSLYYDDIHDFNSAKKISSHNVSLINLKPVNHINMLNKRPDGSIEDVNFIQSIINSIEPIKNVKNDIHLQNNSNSIVINNLAYNTDKNTFEHITKVSSLFSYTEKDLVLLNKQIDQEKESIILSNKNNQVINTFMNETRKNVSKKDIKKPIEAPESITKTAIISKYRNNTKYIRKPSNSIKNMNLGIPENINLNFVSNFEVTQDSEFDYFNDNYQEDNDIYNFDNEVIYGDDVDHIQTPLDKIRSKNSQLFNSNKSSTNEAVYNSSNSSNMTVNNYNNTNLNNQQSNTNVSYNNQQNKTNTSVIVNENVNKIPVAPVFSSPPKVPTVPLIPKVPLAIPKIPAAPIILAKEKPKILEENKSGISSSARGNLMSEIVSDNPMARLKKINTVTNISRPKPSIDIKKNDEGNSALSNVKYYIISLDGAFKKSSPKQI